MSDTGNTSDVLAYVTSDELIAELQRRHEVIVVMRATKMTQHFNEEAIDWKGPLTYCLGLAVKAEHRLNQQMRRDANDDDADDTIGG
jgi:hypothetical protein